MATALTKKRDMSQAKVSKAANAPVLDLEWMRHQAGQVVSLFKVLGNQDRLLLICQMLEGEYSVGELEEMLDIHQPTLSQQLGVLRNEGLVATRREGKFIYYSVAHPHVQTILETLHRLYCGVPSATDMKLVADKPWKGDRS
ncbi:MAG: metalloregulator ArsR/SmtB family transcription factor [Fluviibacter sp.]